MKCFVLTGDDDWALRARRAQLQADLGIAAASVERFDLTDDEGDTLVEAASTFSLFGGARLLDGDPAGSLSAANAKKLVETATDDVTVVLRGPAAVSAAVRKVLAPVAEIVSLRSPTGRAIPARVVEMAQANGVTLDAATRQLLVDRGGHDLPRVAGVLAQLASLGITNPQPAHVDRMLGTSAAPGVPWALSDALEAGDIATALELATSLEPVAVVAYLASRTGQMGRIVDDQLKDPDAISGALGINSRFMAQKAGRLASRLGKRGVAASWDAVAAADRAVKVSPDPRAALDVLIVQLAGVWGPSGAARTS